MKKNAFYAQSGGVTAVINATAGALLLEAKHHRSRLLELNHSLIDLEVYLDLVDLS